jgi:hypothetical protein
MTDDAYLAADAEDRRAALNAATALLAARGDLSPPEWLTHATIAYRWLRSRDSLTAIRVSIVPGTPYLEGTQPMTATFSLDDTDQVVFTLTGQDAKGADVPLDAGYTAAWSLADPDSSGAVLTVSDDTTSATVAAGVPDTNLMLSVVVTNPDSSTLNGAEAIIVLATAATTVGLVAGTPAPE